MPYTARKLEHLPHSRRHCLAVVASLLLVLLLSACKVETRVLRDDFAYFREISDEAARDARGNAKATRGYAVEVARLLGPDRVPDAAQLTAALRQAGLADLWFNDVDAALTIYSGRFASAEDPAARDTLQRLRGAELDPALITGLDGEVDVSRARIVSVTGDRQATADPLDLRRHMGSFSLQVGFYDENFPGDPRAAAEQSARALREQGYPAYYYHGPYISSVCVGIFTRDDFVLEGTTETYGPRIRQLQQTFPYNLANGYPFEEVNDEGSHGPQTSSVIRVI